MKNDKLNNWQNKESDKNTVVSYRGLKFFGLVFVCILTLATMGFSLSSFDVSQEVKNITASWSPNLSDLGKLKFVDGKIVETELEVVAQISELGMPFYNNYFTEVETGVFQVNGLGGVVVKSCLEGVVLKVENLSGEKSIQISHGKGLVSEYNFLDSVGVKEGDKVLKNMPIGVSFESVIQFKMIYKNKVITGLTIKDGELTFM